MYKKFLRIIFEFLYWVGTTAKKYRS